MVVHHTLPGNGGWADNTVIAYAAHSPMVGGLIPCRPFFAYVSIWLPHFVRLALLKAGGVRCLRDRFAKLLGGFRWQPHVHFVVAIF